MYSIGGLALGLSLLTILFIVYASVDFSQQEQTVVIDDSESVSISYKLPGGEGVDYDSLEKTFEEIEVPENVVIPLTGDAVSQEYMSAFNALVNSANQLETQVRINVASAMFDVQEEAEAGNYLVMFQNMLDAKEVNKIAYSMASKLSSSNRIFKRMIATEVPSDEIKLASTALAQDADVLVSVSESLLDALDAALSGSPPTQALVDTIDQLSLDLIAAASTFAESIADTSTSIQAQ